MKLSWKRKSQLFDFAREHTLRQLHEKGIGHKDLQRLRCIVTLANAVRGTRAVTSELLDLINSGRLFGDADTRWEECVSVRRNHEIEIEKPPEREHLSDAEVKLVNEIWAQHGDKDQWQLVEWCHSHCGEWTPLARGCAPIAVERIGQALGKSPEIVQKLAREAAELNMLDEIFAPA